MHSPRTHQLIRERSGVGLDKLSEVVLLQAVGDVDCKLRLSDIAERVGVELSSVSRKVQKLETEGLVERVNDPSDGRAWKLKITDAGARAVTAIAAARSQLADEALATWSTTDRETLEGLLERFARDISRQLENDSCASNTEADQ